MSCSPAGQWGRLARAATVLPPRALQALPRFPGPGGTPALTWSVARAAPATHRRELQACWQAGPGQGFANDAPQSPVLLRGRFCFCDRVKTKI